MERQSSKKHAHADVICEWTFRPQALGVMTKFPIIFQVITQLTFCDRSDVTMVYIPIHAPTQLLTSTCRSPNVDRVYIM